MSLFDDLFCLSLSARDDIAASVREKASLTAAESEEFLKLLSHQAPASTPGITPSFFYLGTCHRVEIYGHGADPEAVLKLWERAKEVRLGNDIRLHQGVGTLRHLIRVTSSLESEVVGETQITGQMKDAADAARGWGFLRGSLDWCVQQSLRVTKRIRSSTGLGEGTVSVAHVAVDGLMDAFDELETKSALVVGAGPMATQALQRLQRKGIASITWCNRTTNRIRTNPLAADCAIDSFENLHELAWKFPVIITATRSPLPILNLPELRATEKALKRKGQIMPGPRIILDLGLPRNVDEKIHGFSGFYVRNVDEFGNRIEANSQQRLRLVGAAESILEEELNSILKMSEARERGPLLAEFREVLESLKMAPFNQIAVEKNEDFEYVARAIHSKLLHRLIEELDQVGEPLASQILGSLVKAWRQPDQWLTSGPQLKNLPPRQKENPA